MKKISLFLATALLLTIFCSCQKSKNDLTGAWYNDNEGVVYVFSEKEIIVHDLYIYSHVPVIYTNATKYTLAGNGQMLLEDSGDSSPLTYTYLLDNDTLDLSIEDLDYQISLTRVKKTIVDSNKIVGNWHLLGAAEEMEDAYYMRNFYDITFYSDGTFKGIRNNEWDEKVADSGTYRLIHDGTALEMAFPIVEQKSIMFSGNGVMILTTDYGELLYIAQ